MQVVIADSPAEVGRLAAAKIAQLIRTDPATVLEFLAAGRYA